MYEYESDTHGVEFWQGVAVITDKASGEARQLTLKDTKTGRNITRQQLRSGINSNGVDKTCQVFWKLGSNDSR